jgi:type II secretory pathway pseudopilin PulG
MKIDNSGQILLEVLLAIAVAAGVAVLGSQLVVVSLNGNKIAGNNSVASGLAEETIEAAKGAALENWYNFYSLTHGSTQYYPLKSSGKWVMTAGAESVPLNRALYSRYFTIQNVCRNITTRQITGITDSSGSATTCVGLSGSAFDPSTQKVTAFVSWPNAAVISDTDYLTRWRNVICTNTDWVGGKNFPTDNVFTTCSVNTYYNDDGNIDNSAAGSIKLKSS